ncbi:MAG: matrixin family metalloprotease [Candidatus Nanopelagicales bacterium]
MGTGRGQGRGRRAWGPLILVPIMAVGMQVTVHSVSIDSGAGSSVPAAIPGPSPSASILNRALAEPPIVAAGPAVRFLSGDTDARTAARWSRCVPIRWTIDPMNIDASGVDESQEIARWTSVVDSFAAATGYRFDYVTSRRGDAGHRPGVLPAIDGIDIVITYESADDVGDYRRPTLDETRRIAESWLSWTEDGSGAKIATVGSVIMDYRDLSTTTSTRQYDPTDRMALMSHEFGHVMGLAHDEDESTVMFDEWTAGKAGLTPADIEGLVLLAEEPCPQAGVTDEVESKTR